MTFGALFLALIAIPGTGKHEAATTVTPLVITRLALELEVDYANRALAGTATLTVRNQSDRPVSDVPLLLNRLMVVARIRSRMGTAIGYTQRVAMFTDDSSLQVNAVTLRPRHPIAAWDSLTMSIEYGGVLVGHPETGALYIKDQVSEEFTVIRADAYAFPVLGVLSWQANRAGSQPPFDFSARITVPRGQVVAMAGVGVESPSRDSLVSWSYRSTAPVPFLNIAVAPYQVLERNGIRIFHFPADSLGAEQVLAAATSALARYAEWFGPLEKAPNLTVIEIPEGFGSQASLTGGILQTADAFRDRSALPQLYHELSHLWDVPDLDQPSPRWNEGLASFLQFRMAAELDGWADWDGLLQRRTKSLLAGCEGTTECDSIPFRAFGTAGVTDRSYPLGMIMFLALYRRLGAERFDRTYGAFVRQHRVSGASTAQLAEAFRQADPGTDVILSDWLITTHWHSRLVAGESVNQIFESYRQN